jgi:hypothetical protein
MARGLVRGASERVTYSGAEAGILWSGGRPSQWGVAIQEWEDNARHGEQGHSKAVTRLI